MTPAARATSPTALQRLGTYVVYTVTDDDGVSASLPPA
jgi:hypothetical protein